MIYDYSAPIRTVYSQCVDLLIQNIARHFPFEALTGNYSFQWETAKLAELGQLRRENLAIIARTIGDPSGMTEIALEKAITDALKRGEPELLAAVKAGMLEATVPAEMSASMQGILRYYSSQAAIQTNLVNTVMLTDSMNGFRRVISRVNAAQNVLRDVAQGALNTATGQVVTGISSLQSAVRDALQQMAQEGIKGFVDKAGHNWSPDAYAEMDIRTTAGNVAREAVFEQNAEFGVDTVIVPVHAVARPGCAPYQGWVISMSNQSGIVTDASGNRIQVHPVSATTYGQPAGLWGINCSHQPDPFIPGWSESKRPIEQGEVNARYEQTQKQRYHEQQVKKWKRSAVAADASGDKAAFAEASAKVKQKQAALRDYCERVNLPYQSDRTQVYGYNHSVSGKVIASNRRKETPVLTPRQSAAKQTATPAPIKRRAQLDPYKDKATAKTLLQAETGMAEADASKVMQDFDAYFTNDYAKFVNGEKPEAVARIDKALSKMVPYDGEIYRGIHLVPRELDSLLDAAAPGAEIRMKSISSWTSNRGVADEFSGKNFSSATETVVFSCKKNLTSVGVRHISSCAKNEDEVLALSTSKWRVVEVKKTEQTYVRFGVTEPKMTYDNRVNGYVQAYDTVIELEEIL